MTIVLDYMVTYPTPVVQTWMQKSWYEIMTEQEVVLKVDSTVLL